MKTFFSYNSPWKLIICFIWTAMEFKRHPKLSQFMNHQNAFISKNVLFLCDIKKIKSDIPEKRCCHLEFTIFFYENICRRLLNSCRHFHCTSLEFIPLLSYYRQWITELWLLNIYREKCHWNNWTDSSRERLKKKLLVIIYFYERK